MVIPARVEHRFYNETPIAESAALNAKRGRRVFMKMECYQPSGSFKIRGMSHLMSTRHSEGVRNFLCSSGGNAGLAVSYFGVKLGVEVTVVVPTATADHVRSRLAELGANFIVHGGVRNEADAFARDLCARNNAVYVSPFDDRLLWEGHATLFDEAVTQCERPDAVILSADGGGLLPGVLIGMHRNGWTDVPVIAAETEWSASFAAAVNAGRPIALEAITSIAKFLGALQKADEAFAWIARHAIHAVTLSDRDAVGGCLELADELRILVEPACGVSRAVLASDWNRRSDHSKLLIIICGGSAVDSRSVLDWRAMAAENCAPHYIYRKS